MKIGFTLKPNDGNIISLEEQITKLEKIGAESAEIPLYELDVICGKEIIEDEIKQLKKITKNSNLEFSVHGSMSVNFLQQEYLEEHKKVLEKEIEVCSQIESKILVTHFGYTTNKIFNQTNIYKDYLAKQNEIYHDLAIKAQSKNVTLCIENIFPFTPSNYAPLPSEVAEEINKIDHPFAKTTIDFSHGYINSNFHKKDFLDEISKMAKNAKHLHVHDSFGRMKNMETYIFPEDITYGQGDIHLPLGWGNLPFDKIFSSLDLSKDIYFNFELGLRYEKYYQKNIESAKQLISKIT